MEEMAGVAVRQQTSPLPLEGIIPVFHQPEDGVEDTTVSTVKSEKARRRSSLLVSRFGQVRHSWSPSIDIMVLNGLYPFQTQTPENPVDIALGQTGVSRAASAVSSLVLKSPLYAQPPVSFTDSLAAITEYSFAHHTWLPGAECRLVWVRRGGPRGRPYR